jgi:hypothetical protein
MIGIFLLLIFILLYIILYEKIRDQGENYLLGVDDNLISVIYLSLLIISVCLIASNAYLKVRGYEKNNEIGYVYLFKSLFIISFISFVLIGFNQGLAYRLNYIVYIASPMVLIITLIILIKIGIKEVSRIN